MLAQPAVLMTRTQARVERVEYGANILAKQLFPSKPGRKLPLNLNEITRTSS